MKGNFEVKSMIYSISSKHFRAMASMLLLLVPEVLFAQYLPDPEYSPLKIRVNLIIVQRADGSGNFQDNAADRSFLRNMMHVTNGVFADLTNRNEEYYPGQNLPFLSNAKLEFVPNIVFVKNETGWNNRNDTNASGVPYLSGWYLDSLDHQICHNDTLPKAINLYFTTDGQVYEQMVVQATTTDYNRLVFFKQHAASEIPVLNTRESIHGRYHTMRCHVGNVWLKLWWKRNVLHEPDWTMEYEVGESVAHEIGHLMGLYHTPDAHIHALMRTKFGGLRDYMTTREIATVHQMFGRYPSLWQFVPAEVVYGSPKADWVVSGEQTWKEDRRVYANLVVKTGATLTIQRELLLPASGTIIIEPGATLQIDGGLVRRFNTLEPEVFGHAGAIGWKPGPPSPYLYESRDLDQAGALRFFRNGKIEAAILGMVSGD
jgi:hypothetical protein